MEPPHVPLGQGSNNTLLSFLGAFPIPGSWGEEAFAVSRNYLIESISLSPIVCPAFPR